MHRAVDLAGDDFRPGNLELESLAPHRLDQDRKMQLATTGNGKNISLLSRLNPEREIGFKLAEQPLAQLARCLKLAFAASERRRVDAERQLQGRLFDVNCFQCFGIAW